MEQHIFSKIEEYMQQCMNRSAHDTAHVYRVLYHALDIATHEPTADTDILIAACLLHDIGRADQYRDPTLCHAAIGSEKAHAFLLNLGFDEGFADHVRACIATHRFRKSMQPCSIEAKILFDADKLDVTGAIGIARTLLYQGEVAAPLYTVSHEGCIWDDTSDPNPTFFREYHEKLEGLYNLFLTKRGYELAQKRQNTAEAFYHALLQEVHTTHLTGSKILSDILHD